MSKHYSGLAEREGGHPTLDNYILVGDCSKKEGEKRDGKESKEKRRGENR